ncbi:cobalamin B12-binding domain-containing protein [Selenomonas ruminantium]|uniref:cobalamin B12-binding domain-containing protein n=1 Tax=Selenomonas ruminantium TaxID=971 RepID=UPI00041240C1|nr:cobalamin B12-binding domain-containing protein [Selenomonas ruminantium]
MRKNKLGKMILGAEIGNCVHVAGPIHFLDLAREEGYQTIFLGGAVDIEVLFAKIEELRPDIVAIGYRLTLRSAEALLLEVRKRRERLSYNPEWCFGGTKPVADLARREGYFSFVSDGYDDVSDSLRYLRGMGVVESKRVYQDNLLERIHEIAPYPLIRHHFGRPLLEETIQGIGKIAEAGVLDVISLGPDQNAQQFFFHPERMKPEFDGAGGVPIRTVDDLKALKTASQKGNYPLMRCYSGTEDVFDCAKLLLETINNAWAAVPLCWYNEMDGRGTRKLETSLCEAQALIRWHAQKGVPVEINEPHHWGLRDAHDVIPVAMAYISALNAKHMGVKHYIAQYMFNNPQGLSFSMDFAKILAMIELVESLVDKDFHVYRETRAGLALFNADANVAKGQLAASTFMQMAVKPQIVHVVGFCEADHAANADEVIESCKIVRGVIRQTLGEKFSMEQDDRVLERKNELISEAKILLSFIEEMYSEYDNPLTNPEVLADCIKKGFIDAVHIKKNEKFRGILRTKLEKGMCLACDENGNTMTEQERLQKLLRNHQYRCRIG